MAIEVWVSWEGTGAVLLAGGPVIGHRVNSLLRLVRVCLQTSQGPLWALRLQNRPKSVFLFFWKNLGIPFQPVQFWPPSNAFFFFSWKATSSFPIEKPSSMNLMSILGPLFVSFYNYFFFCSQSYVSNSSSLFWILQAVVRAKTHPAHFYSLFSKVLDVPVHDGHSDAAGDNQ